jgi:hypothetical protein
MNFMTEAALGEMQVVSGEETRVHSNNVSRQKIMCTERGEDARPHIDEVQVDSFETDVERGTACLHATHARASTSSSWLHASHTRVRMTSARPRATYARVHMNSPRLHMPWTHVHRDISVVH